MIISNVHKSASVVHNLALNMPIENIYRKMTSQALWEIPKLGTLFSLPPGPAKIVLSQNFRVTYLDPGFLTRVKSKTC